jgi:hypothetical protein
MLSLVSKTSWFLVAVAMAACRYEYPVGEVTGDAGDSNDSSGVDATMCWAQGSHVAGKSSPNLPCCPGLVKTPTLYWSSAAMKCEAQFPPVSYTCRLPDQCGNGVCEANDHENLCTCAQDCPSPDDGAQSSATTVPPPGDAGLQPAGCPNESVVLAPVPGPDGASAIALNATSVYVKTRRGVFRIAKTGGSFTPAPEPAPAFAANDRAMDGTYVYYLDNGNVMRSRHDGTMPELLWQGVQDECFAIAVNEEAVYWTNAYGLLYKAPKRIGRVSAPLVIGYGGASDCDDDYDGVVLAVDETTAYWTAGPIRTRVSDGEPMLLTKTCK